MKINNLFIDKECTKDDEIDYVVTSLKEVLIKCEEEESRNL